MVIGKTFPSISKTEIFSKFSETQVLSAVFPQITSIPCRISSPLREDLHPSFSIYMDNGGHIRYKDHADSSVHGGLLDLLCAYWDCTFNQTLEKVCNLMIKNTDITIKPKQIRTFTRKEASSGFIMLRFIPSPIRLLSRKALPLTRDDSIYFLLTSMPTASLRERKAVYR